MRPVFKRNQVITRQLVKCYFIIAKRPTHFRLIKVERKRKRDRESHGAADTTVLYSYDNAGNIVNSDGPTSAAPARTGSTGAPRTGRGSNQFRAGAFGGAAGPQSMAGAGTADIVAALQGDAYLALEGAEPLIDLRTVLPDLEGPDVVCQQPWPSFMETRTSKDHVRNITRHFF